MASEKLSIPLTATKDRNGKQYYIGRIQFPGGIDFKEGAVFWVFTSESGQEELQIGIMDKEKDRERAAKRQERSGQGSPSGEDEGFDQSRTRSGNQGNY